MADLKGSGLVADKLIDLVLMFLGLYAAIAVQDFVDQNEKYKQYKSLLDGFSEELKNNQRQRLTVEAKLGSLVNHKEFGEVKERFEFFKANADYISKFLNCYLDTRIILNTKKRSSSQKKRLKKCALFMKKGFKRKKPDHLALSPVYHRDVWRFYLAGGVHLFQEFEVKSHKERCRIEKIPMTSLAICIGSTYGSLSNIEKQVKEIQDLVNDTYFNKQGTLTALFKEFKADIKKYKRRSDAEAMNQIRKGVNKMVNHLSQAKRDVDRTEQIMIYKIKHLKTNMLKLDERFNQVRTLVDSE